jgi:hypothetical protein
VIRKSVVDEVRLEAQGCFIAADGSAFSGVGPGNMRMPAAKLPLKLRCVDAGDHRQARERGRCRRSSARRQCRVVARKVDRMQGGRSRGARARA